MRMFCIAAMTAGLFTMSATAQTSAGASASGNASVTPGQAGAGANASQSTQTTGTTTNVNVSANAKASQYNENKGTEKSSAGSAAASGDSAAGVNGASGALSSGTTLQAELTKPVDAKKAKSGDEVTAKLTQDVKADGKVVMHKGTKLVGHVTEAQAKSKENAESKVAVVFDKSVLKGGQEMSFSGVIQALAPPVQGTLAATGDESGNLGSGMGSGGGSSMGGGRSGGGLAPMRGRAGAAAFTLGFHPRTACDTAGAVSNAARRALRRVAY